jgi:hypothetical protein
VTTAEGYPDFVKVNSLALSPEARKATGTSPLTLLLYLQTRACFTTGERTKPYEHKAAAKALGVGLHTVKEYFKRLVNAGLIVVKRLAHGVTFTIALPGAPAPSFSGVQESALDEVQIPAPDAPPPATGVQIPALDEVQIPALDEVQIPALQPSRVENPDSERTNQSLIVGGGGTAAGGPAALAPPRRMSPESFSTETLEAIRQGEEARRQAFSPEIRRTIGYKLDAFVPQARWPALQGTLRILAEHPEWNQHAPETWRGQLEKAADAWLLHRTLPPRPSKRPPSGGAAARRLAAAAGITAEDLAEQQRSAEAILGHQQATAQRRSHDALPG